MADEKLNAIINLGEIWYLEVPDITDRKLLHDSEIQKNGSNIADRKNKNK